MIVVVHTPQSHIRLSRRSLEVTTENGTVTRVPLAETERLVIGSRVTISGCALAEMLGKNIPVAIVSSSGRHLGAFEPPSPARGLTRRLQYQTTFDAALRLLIARPLVQAKISNACRILQKLTYRHAVLKRSAILTLKRLIRGAEQTTSMESLRGVEGAATAHYFRLWSQFLPTDQPFEKRSTRPPLNPVNAVISYISTLVYGEILSACLSRGLDPALGCLHETTDDRFSLPLDLMEPFRPVIVEALTLRLFNLRILKETHFQPHGRGVYLNERGRFSLLEQYEDRLVSSFVDARSGQYTTLRAALWSAPLTYKAGLTNPSQFTPFLTS